MRFLSKRNFIAASMTLVVMVAVGFVYAAWTTNGSGSGYAKAGTSQALTTVDATANTTATLYPGVTNGTVYLTIHNPNPYAVTVTGVALNGTDADIAADTGHSGCTTTGVSFTDKTGLSISVPASSNADATVTNAVSMSNASLNACQGAVFTIPVTLTGASS